MIELSLLALLGSTSGSAVAPQPIATVPLTAPLLAQAAPPTADAAQDILSFAVVDALFSTAPDARERQALLTLPSQEAGPFDELTWSGEGRLAAVYNYGEVYIWNPASASPTQVFESTCAYLPNLSLFWANQGKTLLIQEVCDVPNSETGDSIGLYLSDGAGPQGTRPLPGLPDDISSQLYISPDGSQVAYVWQGNIYRLALNGARPRQVTSEPGVYGAAGSPLAWSPDGTQLAFYEGSYPFQRLNVIDTDGRNRKVLTPGPNFQIYRSRIYWSPDSRSIVFFQPFDPPYGNQETLQLVNVATGEIRPLTRPGFYDAVSWSPDGQKLALAVGEVERQSLFVLDLATETFTPLTAEPLAQVLQTLWSPSGSWLAFSGEPVGQELGNQILYTVRPDGSDLRSHSADDEYVYPFTWQPGPVTQAAN